MVTIDSSTLEKVFQVSGTAASVILSIVAVWVAVKANEIAQGQLRVAEAELRPKFRLDSRLVQKGEIPRVEREIICLELWNDGGPLTDFSVFQKSFLEIRKAEEVKYVPAYYFGMRDITRQRDGLLATFYPLPVQPMKSVEYSDERLQQLEQELGSDGERVFIEPFVFLDMSYVDALGRHHDEMFFTKITSVSRGFFQPNFGQRLTTEQKKHIDLLFPPLADLIFYLPPEWIVAEWDSFSSSIWPEQAPGA